MAKAKRYKHITIHPSQGGALIGSTSDDIPLANNTNFLASSANYTEKLNFRREVDGELRREGWDLFNPSGNDDAINSQFPIRGLYQFTDIDGNPTLIACAGNKVLKLQAGDRRFAINYGQDLLNPDPTEEYATSDGIDAPEPSLPSVDYFNNDGEDFNWEEIYTFENHMDAKESDGTYKDPYEGGAYRWEFAEVKNHLIINNGVDLPIIYAGGNEYDKAYPLYGLRENGVMSVGTIGIFQDRLFCADLTVISSGFDHWFESAIDPYATFGASHALQGEVQVQRFQYRIVYSAEGEPKLFNAGIETPSGLIVAESGGVPGTVTINNNGEYEFSTTQNFAINTPASMFQDFDFGIHGDRDHIGVFIDDPELGIADVKFDNEDFSPSDRTAALGRLKVKFPTRDEASFSDSEVLKEQISYIDTSGIFFTVQGDRVIKLVNKTQGNIVLKNPATGQPLAPGAYSCVIRPFAEQLHRPAAFQEFSQDGSRIVKMVELADKLVVYRDSGFFFLTAANSTLKPFAVDPRYRGGRTADFRHTVIKVSGNKHLFMGNTGVYTINRSSTEPQPVPTFELGPPFWQIVPPELSEFIYTTDNPVTREIFINCPLGYKKNSQGVFVDEFDQPLPEGSRPILNWGVIAYDYISDTLSQIDASFTTCCTVRKPKHNRLGPEQTWFLMGVHQASNSSDLYVGTQWRVDPQYGGVLVRYGYGPPLYGETEPYRKYSRIGYGYESRIRSGLIDFGDSFSDKEVRSYVLELSSKYGITPVRVKISTTSAPQGTETVETMSTIDGTQIDYVTLNNVRDENMIPMYLRAPYIRDEITILPVYVVSSDLYVLNGYVEQKVATDPDGHQVESFYYKQNKPTVIDNPIKLVGRTFEASGVDTRSATQSIGQG